MTNPFVFVVGCPRSGTTLLRHILSAHPRILITPEAHWMTKLYKERRGLTPDGMVTSSLPKELVANPKFKMFHLSEQEITPLVGDGRTVTYSVFIARLLDLCGKARGKELVGNKTPDFARKMGLLHSLWPEARFIHLIRDGRDVALSFMNWPKISGKKPGTFPTWKDDPYSTSALWWELNVRRGLDSGRQLGPRLYHETRYESLVTEPEKECRRMCAFLGVPFEDDMLRWNQIDPLKREGSGSLRGGETGPEKGGSWLPITPRLRDWTVDMSPDGVQRFEATAGGLLSELGYPRRFPNIDPELLDHSRKVRASLASAPPDVRPYVS